MNKKVLLSVFSVFFLLLVTCGFAQDYDLIVTTKGDSIACHFDSITETHIYFEMKSQNKWAHTHIDMKDVSEYKRIAINRRLFVFKPGTSIIESPKQLAVWEYQHESRYLCASSAFALGKRAGYYNTFTGLFHDVQFGISDWFSLRLGTSIAASPVWLTAKFTIPVNDNSAFAFGDFVMSTPYTIFDADRFFSNLAFGLYTRRFSGNSISFGAGYWINNDSGISTKTNSLAFSLSGQFRISDYNYIITENFGLKMNMGNQTWNEATGEFEDILREYPVFFGLTGIRLAGKKNPNNSWQFGLIYIFATLGDVPADYTGPEWPAMDRDRLVFIPIPLVSYSRKFWLKQ